jgi:hypothetical protein
MEKQLLELGKIVNNSNGLYKGIKINITSEGIIAILTSKTAEVKSDYFKTTEEAINNLLKKVR